MQVSTHSRPKAAARTYYSMLRKLTVSTHSRPKAAAVVKMTEINAKMFQHTAARRRLQGWGVLNDRAMKFQHTAARRRLHEQQDLMLSVVLVSTHSRPKAAAPYIKKQEKSAD